VEGQERSRAYLFLITRCPGSRTLAAVDRRRRRRGQQVKRRLHGPKGHANRLKKSSSYTCIDLMAVLIAHASINLKLIWIEDLR
jgi:hypothetical protein